MCPTNICIIDDDLIWLKILAKFLTNNIGNVEITTASTAEEALEKCNCQEFDILLVDINLTENNLDGIDLALEISSFSNAHIIMLTSLVEPELIRDSFSAGAVEYVYKDDYKDLPKIIQKVMLQNSAIQVLAGDYQKLKRNEILKDLSPSEIEIFELLEKDFSQSVIEQKLNKTHNTLRSQIKSILKKLKVKNCDEAVKKVNSCGIHNKYKV